MVSLTATQSSNAHLLKSLPNLIAVFVGATNGIGETTLKQFAKHTQRPRVYFVGRSPEAGARIAKECKALNPTGEFNFIQADTSLIRNVDNVCADIKKKEKVVNLLFLSTGTMVAGVKTPEGLHLAGALVLHSRIRFTTNLLPLLRNAPGLRRVVTVFTGGKEGPIDTSDLPGWNITNLIKSRGHASSMVTLTLEHLATLAPEVSFVHDFPSFVKSGIARETSGWLMTVLKVVTGLFGRWLNVPLVESGERHLFFATSARFPAATGGEDGVPVGDGVIVARGTDGKPGSGVYTIDWDGESAGPKVEQLLAGFRKEGMTEKVWDYVEGDTKRITGS